MERLTDCAQGYCEMYCKKYMLCFEDPEDCTFKDEIKLYDAIKSIEGIVPFDRLLELADADRAGKLVVLPCKVGDTVWVIWGKDVIYYIVDRIHILSNNQVQIRAKHHVIDNVYLYPDMFGKTVFLTREEAEAALAQKGGTHEADSV